MGIANTYMTDAVTITPKGTHNGADYTYDGTDVSTVARVAKKGGVRLGNTTKEWVYTLKLWMRATDTIAREDKITYSGDTFIVKEVEERPDINGTLDHYVVYCG